ncbi:hypothetical protein NX722_28375 [Endozoicomonas gorgoniicola]|uniref:Tip attachment protein J central straight fiber domain-containing protein n=1 Tax=Endozoicomonas gorgoniicola TaxID=1234144 RepID=A0ABT3N572_9GAMM|nr:hypothetical protein [Endozoicomonas gorgoniicola]MCW7556483.1 hypothetical protein [Endozoicomonas gorgoniicola]
MAFDLPPPPKSLKDDFATRRFFDSVWRQLKEVGSGVTTINKALGLDKNSGSEISGGEGDELNPILPDLTPPPRPKNIRTSEGMGLVFIEWDNPNLSYSYRAEVWRSDKNDVGAARLIWSGQGLMGKDALGSDMNPFYYWVRFVRDNGYQVVYGPWHQTGGTKGQARFSSDYILKTLTDADGNRLPYVVKDGKYFFNSSYHAEASIISAAIENLDVAKIKGDIASFLKTYITDGFITNAMIGNEIKSDNYVAGKQGWIIKKQEPSV